jgi:hypothetical protein
MHRADPCSDRQASPHRRGHRHHPPAGAAASMLLQPPPGQGPAPLIPRPMNRKLSPAQPASVTLFASPGGASVLTAGVGSPARNR